MPRPESWKDLGQAAYEKQLVPLQRKLVADQIERNIRGSVGASGKKAKA